MILHWSVEGSYGNKQSTHTLAGGLLAGGLDGAGVDSCEEHAQSSTLSSAQQEVQKSYKPVAQNNRCNYEYPFMHGCKHTLSVV